MADNELKRLLQGLFSDIPTEIAPGEAPAEEPPLTPAPVPDSRDRRDEARPPKAAAPRPPKAAAPSDAREAQKLDESRLEKPLGRRAVKLQTAAEVSSAASSILDLDQLLPQVVKLIRNRFNLYYAGIFLLPGGGQAQDQYAVLRAATGRAGQQMLKEGYKLEVGGRSMIGWCIANAQARISADVGEDAVHFRNPRLPETHSEMALPLRSRGRVIGAMTIQSVQRAAFSEEDSAILQSMADQLAIAIENARLFQEREQRIAELAILNEIGQALSAAPELDDLLKTIHLQVSRLFDTANFYIATYQEGSDEWTSVFRLEKGQQQPRARHSIEAGLTGYIIRSRQPLLFRTAEETTAYSQAQGIQIIGEPARSWLGVPLIAADKLIGVMTVQDYAHEYRYGEHDLTLFSTIGAEVANALGHLLLLEETRYRARELEVINEVGRTITSVLDLDQVIRQIVDLLKTHFGYYFIGISLVERDHLIYQYGSTIGDSQTRLDVGKVIIDRLDNGEHGPSLIAEAVRTGQPVLSHDVLTEPRYLSVAGLEAVRSELDMPIEVKGQVIGVLDVQSDRPFAFGPTDTALLQSLASQVGAAIENARLFEQTRHHATRLQALYDTSLRLAAQLETPELLRLIVEQAVTLLEAEAGGFYFYDPASDELIFSVATGYFVDFIGQRLKPGEGLSGQVFQSRHTQAIDDYHTWSERAAIYQDESRITSILGVPLLGREGVLGVLDIAGGKQKPVFDQDDVHVAELFAAQAATALENARLLEETLARADELAVVNEVGQAIVSVLDLDTVLRQIVDTIKVRLGHYFVGILLVEGNQLVFRSGSLVGDSSLRWDNLGLADLSLPLDGTGLNVVAAMSGKAVLVNDVSQDARYGTATGLEAVRSELDVPIEVKGRVIGTLTVQSDRLSAFRPTDVDLIQSLASQAGVAIDNARLFNETEEALAETETLYNASRLVTSAGSLQEIVAAVTEGMYVPAINRAVLWGIERAPTEGREGKPEAFVALANWYSGEGTPSPPLGTRFPIAAFPAARLVLSTDSLFFEDIQQDDRIDPVTRAVFEQQNARAVAILPLWPAGGRRQTGALMLVGEKPHRFTATEIRPYRSLASQMAIVIENRRLLEEAQQTAQRSRALYETSRALSSSLEEEPLMQAILKGVYDTLGCEFANISIVDEQARTISSRHLIWRGEFGVYPEWIQMSQYPLDHPDIIADIYRTGRTEIIGGWDERFSREIWEKFGHERFLRIFMPIKLRDRVSGVIEVAYDKSQKESISEDEVQVLAAFMDQAALTLQNARLFEQTQLRTEQLAVLNEMGRTLTATLDVQTVLDNVYHYTSRLMDTTNFYVALYDETQDEIDFVLDLAAGKKRPTAPRKAGKGLTEYVIRTREPLLMPENIRAHVAELTGVELIGQDAQSWLGVPMMAGDRVFGVVAVQSYTTPRLYNEQHRELLSAVASQAAIALQNTRLFEETQQAARRLGEERTVLRTLIDSLPDYVWVKDSESRFVTNNKAHLRVLRATTQEEVIGKSDLDIFPEELGRKYYEDEREVVRTGQPLIDHEEYTIKETGEIQWLWTTKVPVRDSQGKITAIVGINRDISERKEAEVERERLLAETQELAAALQASEERYTKAVQASDIGLWDWDIANNTLYWSPELKGLLGYADDELEIDFETFESLEHPDDRKSTGAAIEAHLKDQVPYTVEQRLRAKSGEYRWFLVSGQAVWDEAGTAVRMTGVTTDITERKEADAAIERRRGQLECLSDIGQKIGEQVPTAEFLQWVTERIPAAMQYADLCVAAVQFGEGADGQVYGTAEAMKLPCQMVQGLYGGGDPGHVGRITIAYTEERDFLDEESALLGDIARRVSGYIENRRLLEETQQAARRLEDERALLRTIIDTLPDYIYVKDRQSRFVLNNAAHYRLMGMQTQEQVLGKTDMDVFPRELAIQYYTDEQELMQKGEILIDREEPVMDQMTGEKLWVTSTKVPLRDAQGQVYGFVGLTRDITERRRAEEVLERRRAQLECLSDIGQKIGESLPVAEFLQWVAERMPAAFHYPELCLTAIEFKGTTYGTAEAMGQPREMVQSLRIGDETVGRVHVTYPEYQEFADDESALLGDIVRRVSGYIENRQLLEETEQASRRLAEERALLRTLIDSLPDPIFVMDRDIRFVLTNMTLAQRMGVASPEEIVGDTDFDRFPQEQAAIRYADSQEVMRSGQPLIDHEEYVMDERGEWRWVLTSKVPLKDEQGRVTGLVGTSRDITDRKRAEEVLERRRAQLECLSDIGQKAGESLPVSEFLQWVAERIPPAMQFPALCMAAVEFEGVVYGHAEAVTLPYQIVQNLAIGVAGERVDDQRAGRITIAYTEERDFLDEESALLGDISRRIGGYLESQRLFEQTRAALAEVEATHRSYLRRSWQEHLRQREMLRRSGFLYDQLAGKGTSPMAEVEVVTPAPDIWRPEMERAMREGSPSIVQDKDEAGERAGLAIPITVRGEAIGVLGVEAPGGSRQWTEDDIALIQAVSDQLGQTLETARLFADTQRRAERERLIGEITTKIRASTDMHDILETATVELGEVLGTSRAFARVGIEGLEARRPVETNQSPEPKVPLPPVAAEEDEHSTEAARGAGSGTVAAEGSDTLAAEGSDTLDRKE